MAPRQTVSGPEESEAALYERVKAISSNKERKDGKMDKLERVTTEYGPIGNDVLVHGLGSLAKTMPVLMASLDEVARIHPFIAAPVIAFKAVYTLVSKRKENDQQVLVLYALIADMMEALTPLREVKDPSSSSVESQLTHHCLKATEKINKCAHLCDQYSKLTKLVKLIKSPVWDMRLARMGTEFREMRNEFRFALEVSTRMGVDRVEMKLDEIGEKMVETNRILDLFQAFMSPSDLALQSKISALGGNETVQTSDQLLSSLLSSSHTPSPSHHTRYTLDNLKSDLSKDIGDLLSETTEMFERKVLLQISENELETKREMNRVGDRVIEVFNRGAYDRILDKNIHYIWKDMGWKGHVKARSFVLALRDHFIELREASKRGQQIFTSEGTEPLEGIPEEDEWALDYMDVQYLQPISEAFDDDASGFITIKEVNEFTISRPAGWSLLRWMAYWAIGINGQMSTNAHRIHDIFTEMFSLCAPGILHPTNVLAVRDYLQTVWRRINTITQSLEFWNVPDHLSERFKEYTDEEEGRIKKNLEAIKYDIDEMSTLELVVGPGRIEKTWFVLVRMLLERDLKIFHIARRKTLSVSELTDSADTLLYALDATLVRHGNLKDMLSHRVSDIKEAFKRFFFGMYEYINHPSLIWSSQNVKKHFYPQTTFKEEDEGDEEYEKFLNFKTGEGVRRDTSGYDNDTKEEATSPALLPDGSAGGLAAILGTWHQLNYENQSSQYVSDMMLRLKFKPDLEGANKFRADGMLYRDFGPYTLTGTCESVADGSGSYSITYIVKYASAPSQKWTGTWNPENPGVITGTWGRTGTGIGQDNTIRPFIMSRLDPYLLAHRPGPKDFSASKSRALWRYALDATLDDVKRRRFVWQYFLERQGTRKRFIDLCVRCWYFGDALNNDEYQEWLRIKQRLVPGDARFYTSCAQVIGQLAIHQGVSCDACNTYLGQDRVICLECESSNDYHSTIDLCNRRSCISASLPKSTRQDLTSEHLPTHLMVNIRTMMTFRHIATLDVNGRKGIEKAKGLFEKKDEKDGPGDKLRCVKCGKTPEIPCWYCADCPEEDGPVFFCLECDPPGGITLEKRHPPAPVPRPTVANDAIAPGGGESKEASTSERDKIAHAPSHLMVLVAPLKASTADGERERSLKEMQERLVSLEGRLGGFEDRLGSIEELLRGLMRAAAGTAEQDIM